MSEDLFMPLMMNYRADQTLLSIRLCPFISKMFFIFHEDCVPNYLVLEQGSEKINGMRFDLRSMSYKCHNITVKYQRSHRKRSMIMFHDLANPV